MNGQGQSDRPVVPPKSPNKTGPPVAEGMEGRGLAKGNPSQQHAPRTQGRAGAPSALERVREGAERDKQVRFTALLHHVYDVERLRAASFALKRDAAPGVDGETWRHYGEALEANLVDLSERLKRGAYRAKPVRRAYIPKADGRQRPLGVPVLEDKLVQRATVEVLNAIYEADFLGFSSGFRPGRSPHHALDALYAGLLTRKVNWVLDADLRGFFDAIDHGWLVKFVEHRIADRRVVRLIQKWLNAGVLEDGTRTWSETGTPQGGSISPLLANVYLHYAFDLWVQRWQRTQACGDMIVVRYADDFIVGFQHRADAERFLADLRERLAKFGLELHPEKTRLLEFGPYAAEGRRRAGRGKPETFDFLGFTHSCGKKRNGRFTVLRQTMRKRLQAKLSEVKTELRRRWHVPIPQVGAWLRTGVEGHFRYYGVPMNGAALHTFRLQVVRLWHRALARRSHKGRVRWERMWRLANRWLPLARIYHPYPLRRLGVVTLRQEPSAVIPLAGICGGGYEQSSIPTPTRIERMGGLYGAGAPMTMARRVAVYCGAMETDRFGNPLGPALPYARGRILTSTEDDFRKLRRAWRIIEQRIHQGRPESVFNFSGLERSLPLAAEDLRFADDELAPALYLDRLTALALEHLGGAADRHDVVLLNRMTGATLATHLALVKPGDVVIGVSASHSHPSVVRAAAHVGAKFVDTSDLPAFAEALEREGQAALVVLTRLAVTYELLPVESVREVVRLAHERGAPVYVDDAGGGRVGPAIFGQPRLLELGVDVGATGLDKYGTIGPRLGLLGGERALVAQIRARAFEFGLEARPMLYPAAVRSLEQYTPERVRALVESTKEVARALRSVLGSRLHETPVTAQLLAEDILELAMERARVVEAPIVPYEATAALAMLLLEDHGVLTVHFAGLPPGTSTLLFKFIPPETLARFGGPEALARAVDSSLNKLASLIGAPEKIRSLLLGDA